MDSSIILVVVVALAVAWYLWSRRDKQPPTLTGTTTAPPAAGTAPAPAPASPGALGSYDDYRRVSPSNMVYGKLTCNRCGSNLIAAANGTASCLNCGASLYRA